MAYNLQRVKSSLVKAVGYDEASQEFVVVRSRGRIGSPLYAYVYFDVPAAVAGELLQIARENPDDQRLWMVRGYWCADRPADQIEECATMGLTNTRRAKAIRREAAIKTGVGELSSQAWL